MRRAAISVILAERKSKMDSQVTIRMMGEVMVLTESGEEIPLAERSRKGVDLLEYLVLCQGKPVPKQRLLNFFWPQYRHENPVNAMKTLISRFRKILNDIVPGLGACIASERGIYRFSPIENLTVDLWELMKAQEELSAEYDPQKKLDICEQIRSIYRGDLFLTGDMEGGEGYATALRRGYVNAVYTEIELLKAREEYTKIESVCRDALAVDVFDDRMNMELMEALAIVNRTKDAMEHYNRAAGLNQRYLDSEMSDEMKVLRNRLLRSQNAMNYNMDFILRELHESENKKGAYYCEYPIFREIYNLQLCNMDRLGATLFLALIIILPPEKSGARTRQDIPGRDPAREPSAAGTQAEGDRYTDGLIEILRDNLRRNDIVTKYAQYVAVVLLPTVNYVTGNLVLERIHQIFTSRFAGENVTFQYRLRDMGHAGKHS